MVLTWRCGGASASASARAAIVRIPGVAKRSNVPPGGSSTGGTTATARSTLAAYPPFSQRTMSSSPASDGTMNSTLALPPMAPEEASTAMAGRPMRSKMRV